MTNRDHRRAGERPEFTREDAIRIQRGVFARYTNPPVFKPGDLIQSVRHFASWDGIDPERVAQPLIVIEVYPDVSVMTGEATDKGVPGIKFATLDPYQEGIAFRYEHTWLFEPYAGPTPDEH